MSDLKQALTEDMGSVRETEFDHRGTFERMKVETQRGYFETSALVDRLGRVVTPAEGSWEGIISIHIFSKTSKPTKVVKTEQRFQGDQPITLIHYLEVEDDGVD